MTVTARSSTLYASLNVSKYLGDARDAGGRIVPIRFAHTVVSGETGGASAGVQDTVNLCVLPANCEVVDLIFVAEDLWASAAANGTLQLGDSGDAARYMLATELYTTAVNGGGPLATEGMKRRGLAYNGQNYRPTADVVVIGTWKVANPVVGKSFKGMFLVVPGV